MFFDAVATIDQPNKRLTSRCYKIPTLTKEQHLKNRNARRSKAANGLLLYLYHQMDKIIA